MKNGTLKDRAYRVIKEKIISCEYPPNAILNEGQIQAEINVGRTPVREAISCLAQENLLRIIPKKGIIISELSINEILMTYDTRELIEPYASDRKSVV